MIGDTSSTQGDGNSYGHYWSSTLSTWPWSAQAVQTTSSSHSVGSAPREYRLQIRPVCASDPDPIYNGFGLEEEM